MRRIFHYEVVKLISQKGFLIILAVLLAVNGVLVYHSATKETFSSSPLIQKAVYDDLDGKTNQEKLEFLTSYSEELKTYVFLSGIDDSIAAGGIGVPDWLLEEYQEGIQLYEEKYREGNYLKYSEDLFSEKTAVDQVLAEINTLSGYDAYLEGIDEKAEIMTSSSLFSNPDTFSYRNIQRTPGAFHHLKGNQLKADIPLGVTTATQADITDILAVLMILYLCICLFIRERENKLLMLVKPTTYGRGGTIAGKLLTLFLASLSFVLLFYGTNFLIGYCVFGFGDLHRYIQSVNGFIGCPYALTVLQYFIVYLVSKIAVYFFTALFIGVLCLCVKNTVFVYAVTSLFFGGSFLLYLTIPPTSWLSPLKLVNLINFLRTTNLYKEYVNVNFLGYPINLIPIFIVTCLLLSVICIILAVHLFCKHPTSRNLRVFHPAHKKTSLPKIRVSLGILKHEMYKSFRVNKALWILLLYIVVQCYLFSSMQPRFSVDDLYYKQYMTHLSGELTDEKEAFVEEEQENLEKAREELDQLLADYQSQKITDNEYSIRSQELFRVLGKEPAFQKVQEVYQHLLSQKQEGKNPSFVYDAGYDYLTAEDGGSRDLLNILKSGIVLILCCFSIFSYEHQSQSIRLIHSCKYGRGSLYLRKWITGLLLTILLFLITYIPEVLYVVKNYGLPNLNAPIYSLIRLSNLNLQLSLLHYLILLGGIKLIGLLLAMQLILCLSILIRNSATNVITEMFLLILPSGISLLGIRNFESFTLIPVLSGNLLFLLGKVALPYGILVLGVFLLALILSYGRFCHGGKVSKKASDIAKYRRVKST